MTQRRSDLDVLAHNIQIWRRDKKSKAARLPDVLVKEIIKLSGQYGAKHVCEHVGLSNHWRWQERVEAQKAKARSKKIISVSGDKDLTALAASVLSANTSVPSEVSDSSQYIEIKKGELRLSFHNYSANAVLSALQEAGLC